MLEGRNYLIEGLPVVDYRTLAGRRHIPVIGQHLDRLRFAGRSLSGLSHSTGAHWRRH